MQIKLVDLLKIKSSIVLNESARQGAWLTTLFGKVWPTTDKRDNSRLTETAGYIIKHPAVSQNRLWKERTSKHHLSKAASALCLTWLLIAVLHNGFARIFFCSCHL